MNLLCVGGQEHPLRGERGQTSAEYMGRRDPGGGPGAGGEADEEVSIILATLLLAVAARAVGMEEDEGSGLRVVVYGTSPDGDVTVYAYASTTCR